MFILTATAARGKRQTQPIEAPGRYNQIPPEETENLLINALDPPLTRQTGGLPLTLPHPLPF